MDFGEPEGSALLRLAEQDPACSEAIGVLVRGSFGGVLMRVLRRWVGGDRDTALDLGQDTWRRVWKARGTWKPDRPEEAAKYVLVVARNTFRDFYRAERRRAERTRRVALETHASDSESRFSSEEIGDVQRAFSKLPLADQHILRETVLGERTDADVGHDIGKSTEAVKKQRQRALMKLRRLL